MQRKKLCGSGGDRARILSLSMHALCHTGKSAANTGDFPLSAQLRYGTATSQRNLVFTRLPLPKWWPWGWGMDKGHNQEASVMTLSRARPQSHFTLPFRLQTPGNLYVTRHLLRRYQSQEFPPTSVPDISSALSHDVFPETRVLLFKLNLQALFLSTAFMQIYFLLSPCTGNLGKQQVNEFWKTPSWQVTSYSRKTFITIISIIKYYAANAIQKELFVGRLVWSSCPWRHISEKLPGSVVWPQWHLPSRGKMNTLHRKLVTYISKEFIFLLCWSQMSFPCICFSQHLSHTVAMILSHFSTEAAALRIMDPPSEVACKTELYVCFSLSP